MPEEGKKEKDDDKIVMRVDMDCAGCKEKVKRALKTVEGVEKIDIDMAEQKVTVRGNVDPRTVCDTVRKRSGKRTVLLSPDLKTWEQKKKGKEDGKTKEDKKKEEPPDSTVVLKVRMHCGGCARQISKSLYRMEGVTDVVVDSTSDKVTVKGRGLDANELCDRVRRSGKQCEIVPQPKKAEKKEEKKEEKKDKGKPADEKKEEKASEEKKEEKKAEEKTEDKPAEEKKEQKAEEKKEAKEQKEEKKADEAAVEVKKYEYNPYRSAPEYIYPPQLFSDENPNACFIM